jgi:hypothetical protein
MFFCLLDQPNKLNLRVSQLSAEVLGKLIFKLTVRNRHVRNDYTELSNGITATFSVQANAQKFYELLSDWVAQIIPFGSVSCEGKHPLCVRSSHVLIDAVSWNSALGLNVPLRGQSKHFAVVQR